MLTLFASQSSSSLNSSGGSAQSSGNISGTVSAAALHQQAAATAAVAAPVMQHAAPSRVPLQQIPVVTPAQAHAIAPPSSTPSRAAAAVAAAAIPATSTPSRQALSTLPVPAAAVTPARQSMGVAFQPFDYTRFESFIPGTLKAALNYVDQLARAAPAVPTTIVAEMPIQIPFSKCHFSFLFACACKVRCDV